MIPIAFADGPDRLVRQSVQWDWGQLTQRLAQSDIGIKDGTGWLPVEIDRGPRNAERVKSVSLLVLDVEAKSEKINGVKVIVGPEPPTPEGMRAELEFLGWHCTLHTTYQHTVDHPRYRLVFELSHPIAPTELKPLGSHVANLLGLSDCYDKGALEPARFFYLPRRPADSLDKFIHVDVEGEALPVDELLVEAQRVAVAAKAASRPRHGNSSTSVIDAYNAANDVGVLLEQHRYKPQGRNRWLWPGSTTGIPGVRLLPDSNPPRVYSSHGGDPLNDGHAHDAFDLWRILHHGGDVSAAVKEAAQAMGLQAWQSDRHAISADIDLGLSSDSAAGGGVNNWPEPQPLAIKVEPEPYPIDALPITIRAAVEEVQGFTKVPFPLAASSALAALSLAIQAHVDAKRAERLTGPVGIFLLTIADSGERKSTCDGFFTKAIRDYEDAQASIAKPILNEHNAKMEAWEAKRNGIKDKIRQLAKVNKLTTEMESALLDQEKQKPAPPRIPRMLYADATPEALAYGLATNWPSGGVVSAEGGIVFGSHGMGKDSVMRNLSLLNQLWDGTTMTIDRRTSTSFTVRGARLTVALQVQESTLREFFIRSGTLARGTGFLARFLVAWPESTQGFRPFTEAPDNWPHLAVFNRRIAEILDQPTPIDEGTLTPALLALTADAKAEWVAFHDAIERELGSGGELYDVRDVASKSADNAVRLAALFHLFDLGNVGAIGIDAFEGASRIAAWHLNESRRFFGELALPAELADAARLDRWMIEYCQRESTHLVPIAKLQQGGPSGLRSKASIDGAMRELQDAGRAKWIHDGKRKIIAVNPALLVNGAAT